MSTDTSDNWTMIAAKQNNGSKHDVPSVPVKKDAETWRSDTWRSVWYDFTQDTTLHGINKITEDTPFILRRLIWICVVMGGIALFLYQFSSSYIAYLGYPVTVNVKINYNETLKFPAITICNQNDFRSTASANIGRYKLVRDYYSNLQNGGIDLESYNATNMTLTELYEETAHRKENMIVNCKWDRNGECSSENDFHTTRTDYGYCYTFNGRHRDGGPLSVSTTGVDRGLKLTMNIEQYEYMLGPNPGAGIKILIHDQDELPLVGDLGQAIPPGSYAFISIETVSIKNMKPPHGVCNDSVQLDYYDHYSVSACKIECKMKYVIENCGCREVYMPSINGDLGGYPPICDLETYQSCYQEVSMSFIDENCTCPVPCKNTMFASSISYASISNFDVERFLQSNGTDALRGRHREAWETRDRMEERAVLTDTNTINDFSQKLETLKDMVEIKFKSIINETRDKLADILADLDIRKKFHLENGLDKLHYTTVNEFVRGFDLRDERTFTFVTLNYNEIVAYLKEHYPKIADPSLPERQRYTYYQVAIADLYKIKTAATRAKDQMNEVKDSFLNATSLAQYMVTPDNRYDAALLSKDIISTYEQRDSLEKRIQYYMDQVDWYLEDIEILENMLSDAFHNSTLDMDELDRTLDKSERGLIYRCERINYYRYVIRERHATVPQTITQGLIDEFNTASQYVDKSVAETRNFISNLLTTIEQADRYIHKFENISDSAKNYLNLIISKTELADLVLSEETSKSLVLLTNLMNTISGDFTLISSKLSTVQINLKNLWAVILDEFRLDEFYKQIREDVIAINQNVDAENGKLKKILAELIDVDVAYIEENRDKLFHEMNADFPILTSSQKISEIDGEIISLRESYGEVSDMRPAENFYESLDNLKKHLQEFKERCEINVPFFRENFMQVGIFMSQLNYEEIEQQEAYSETNLWSDIGGSLGLFIGASMITVFEVLDVIIHNSIKFYCCAKGRKEKKPDAV